MSDETLINSATAATTVVAVIAMIIGMRASTKRIQIPLAAVGLVASITAGTLFWYTHRPLPTNETRTLFQGVDYIRDVRGGAVIVHVVKIDLDAPGIHFMVTPYTPTLGWVQAARTTSQFLREYQLQVAINGDFFDPWRDYGLWDYYPHVGDPVNLRGLSASNGEVYAEGYTPPPNYATLYISADNQASFNQPIGDIYNAISGNMMLISNGKPEPVDSVNSYLSQPHPRTAVALDESGRRLILIVVDGRQPNYSEGVTIPKLIDIVQTYGGYNALNLDGGGSVTLAVEGGNGQPIVLNSPIHSHIPGLERPVANHLGLFAEVGHD